MTVEEIIQELEKYPPNMRVVDSGFNDFDKVGQTVWVHNNYPYDKSDEEVIMIE